MNTVHDFEIDAYNINFKTGILTMDISLNDISKQILFMDVLAYEFSDEIPYSIILDIDKLDLNSFFKNNKERLESKKNSGWPILYRTLEELETKVKEKQINYYVLFSSYGMNGWILAKNKLIKTT